MPDPATAGLATRVRHVANATYVYVTAVDGSMHSWDMGVLYFPSRLLYERCKHQLPKEMAA